MVIYFIAMRLVYFYEKIQITAFVKEVAMELRYKDIPTKTAIVNYSINAFFVIAAAIFLPKASSFLCKPESYNPCIIGHYHDNSCNNWFNLSDREENTIFSMGLHQYIMIYVINGSLLYMVK